MSKIKSEKALRMLPFFGVPRERIMSAGTVLAGHELGPAVLNAGEPALMEMRQRLTIELHWQGEKLVLVHPGSSALADPNEKAARKDIKWWPVENWTRVVQQIRTCMPEAFVILTGMGSERFMTEKIAHAAGGQSNRVVSWAGNSSLRQLMALQTLAHSCIANDTGAAHVCVATGCPTVVLLNMVPPDEAPLPNGWGPLSTVSGFRDKELAKQADPGSLIKKIRPETVVEAWSQLPARPDSPDVRQLVSHYFE